MAKKKHSEQPPPKLPMENLFFTVDACAELSGQPYKVLEALHDLYAITGRRKLRVIDTEQGLHEKANCSSPEIMSAIGPIPSPFGRFLRNNPEWTQIIQTDTCREFREDLANIIFPQMVLPLVEAAEDTTQRIREEAFAILQQRGETALFDKTITKPSDIEVRVKFNDSRHHVFDGEVLNAAADRVMDGWPKKVAGITALNDANKKKNEKGYMAAMVKSLQETKAFSYVLMSKLHPSIAREMGIAPEDFPEGQVPSLAHLRENSYLYENLTLPAAARLWEMPEMIQAVRLTNLWPWAQPKGVLSEASTKILKKSHSNTGDVSYLRLFTDILPEMSDPANTLFVLLTHDAPLRERFLEASTGVRRSMEKPNHYEPKKEVFHETPLYSELNLTKRAPERYTAEAALVGSEFVEFTYKELVAALKPYIDRPLRRELIDEIGENGFGKGNKVGESIGSALKQAEGVPVELKMALERVLAETQALEMQVKQDIRAYGVADKAGHYGIRKNDRMGARKDIIPNNR